MSASADAPRRAMVLAAGRGQRLRPLTACLAKPAIPFLGRALLEHSLRRLVRLGVREAVVNLHHLAPSLEPVLARGPKELVVHRSVEEELLGTAGGLKKAEGYLSDETFLLMNGDTLFDFDLKALLAVHRERSAEATLVLRKKSGASRYSTVRVDDSGRVIAIDRRDRGPGLMFAGVWLMEPKVLGWLSGRAAGLEVELLPRLIEAGTAFASVQDGPFVTIDTPARYWWHSLNAARRGLFERDWAVEQNGPRLFCGEKARVASSATIEGIVVLGDGCRVGRGARLRNVVCWSDVHVPAGAVVEDAVIADGVRLGPRAELSSKVVMRTPGERSTIRRRELVDDLVLVHLDTTGGSTRGPRGAVVIS